MKRKWIIGLLTLVLALGVGAAQVQGQSYRPYTNTIDLTVKNVPTFEAGLGIETSGATWYVNSAATGTAAGTSWTNACLTVDACINLATASNGDIIRVAENHAESYTAANGFDVDKAGLTIIMHGTGTSAPTFTFADTDADIAIGAANVTIIGGRYLAGISAVVRGISIEAAGDNFTLIDPVFPEPLTSSFEFLDAILMASGADGFRLIRPVAFSADATGATHFLTASAGVVNNLQIIDPYIYGEYSVAPIFSDQINLEVLIKGGVITNLTTGQFAIEFTGASTGSIEDVLLRTDTQAIAVDPGSMTLKNVMWDDEDTADTIAIPVILGTAGVDSIGSVNSTTTDSIHGKIGTDTEMADASLYDMLVAIDDYIDTEVAAILADTDTISGISLPVAPVANSLAAFIASGGTALGTELADSKSLVDAIGTDGTTVADTATGIAGMIGVDDADNVMATTAVVANADGSVFERLEYIQQRQSFVTKSAVTSSSIPNNTQTAGAITGAATGDILAEEISFQCGATGWATPTNIEISSDNVRGPTGAAAPIFLEIIGSFGAASRAGIEDATSEEFPWLVESGKKLFIHGDDAAGTGGGICDVVIKWTPVTAGATIAGSDLP